MESQLQVIISLLSCITCLFYVLSIVGISFFVYFLKKVFPSKKKPEVD